MAEPDMNIRMVCTDCVSKRKMATQQNLIKLLKSAQGRGSNNPVFVKLPFEENGEVEHMWVKLSDISYETRKVRGTLDNDPVLVRRVSCGDEVECDFEDIEEVL